MQNIKPLPLIDVYLMFALINVLLDIFNYHLIYITPWTHIYPEALLGVLLFLRNNDQNMPDKLLCHKTLL